jgi:membrane associated rhomboid family serine protease
MGGASTGVSGLIAAAGWVRGGFRGMLGLALPWIGFNIVIALTGMVLPIPISWAGHIGGTVAGALLFPLVLAVFGEAGRPRFSA